MAASGSFPFLMQPSFSTVQRQQRMETSYSDHTKDLQCLEAQIVTSPITTSTTTAITSRFDPRICRWYHCGDEEICGHGELAYSFLPQKENLSSNVAWLSKVIQCNDWYTGDTIPLHVHDHIIEPHFMVIDDDEGTAKSNLSASLSSLCLSPEEIVRTETQPRVMPKLTNNGKKLQDTHIRETQNYLLSHETNDEFEPGHISVMIESPIYSTPTTVITSDHNFRDTLERVRMGLEAGHSPELAVDGSGGVYFMKDECGLHNVAVFKPMDEEPMCINNPKGYNKNTNSSSAFMWVEEGLKKGTKIGEGAIKEVAAYILDQWSPLMKQCGKDEEGLGFSGVPPTIMARCYHEVFNYGFQTNADSVRIRTPKVGSLQKFIEATGNCEDMSPSLFSMHEVHKITVLDLRLANTDRHGGNILVSRRKDGKLKLVPIDHGYCLPDKFGDCTFEWLYWPQASQPYEASTLEYIKALDADRDIRLLKRCGWTSLRPQCACVLRISTLVLKKGASAGLTPFQIGSIVSCNRYSGVDSCAAPIELILEKAHEIISSSVDDANEAHFMNIIGNLLDDHIAKVKLLQ